MGTTETRQRWPGGYIRDGVFVIERRIKSLKFHISTRCTSLRAAMKQLEAFEMDPAHYDPTHSDDAAAVVMTKELIEEFHQWHLKRVTGHWARANRSLLYDWANEFRGKDLRFLDLVRDLKEPITGATQRPARIKAIRSFFKWLRQERGLIRREQDASLDLPVPQPRPAQETKPKAVPFEHVAAVAAHLPVRTRDVLGLLCATGWHVSEVRRFAVSGSVRTRLSSDAPGVEGVLTVLHKRGRRHLTVLTRPEHLAIAERVKATGGIHDNSHLRDQLHTACDKAGVPRFTLGVIRHSVSTWLVQAGVPVEQVARFLGHQSSTTTQRFYVDHAQAALILPTRALKVV